MKFGKKTSSVHYHVFVQEMHQLIRFELWLNTALDSAHIGLRTMLHAYCSTPRHELDFNRGDMYIEEIQFQLKFELLAAVILANSWREFAKQLS